MPIQLIDIARFRAGIQTEWNVFYGARPDSNFVPGEVFPEATMGPGDYRDMKPTPTVAVPNGIVVNENVDDELVRFVTDTLFRERDSFEQALWDGRPAVRPYPRVEDVIPANPLYCMVPLHPVATEYYQNLEIKPLCG